MADPPFDLEECSWAVHHAVFFPFAREDENGFSGIGMEVSRDGYPRLKFSQERQATGGFIPVQH